MELEQRVAYLERRVTQLENALAASAWHEASPIPQAQNNINKAPEAQMNGQVPEWQQVPIAPASQTLQRQAPNIAQAQPIPQAGPVPNTSRQQIPYPQAGPRSKTKAPRKQSDFETFVGKHVSVIIASVLIFVGVVVFAGALLPYLTDTLKFILMCGVSAIFTISSFLLVRKKENTLTVSLLACSLGTVYITLFTGKLYFHMVNTILLYIALAGWLGAIYYCSRYKSMLFNIIGQAGILISLILCVIDAIANKNTAFVFYALIYVTATQILYNILFGAKGHVINTASMLLSVAILSVPVFKKIEERPSLIIPFTLESITMQEFISESAMHAVVFILLSILLIYAIVINVIRMKQGKISDIQYIVVNYTALFTYLITVSQFSWTKGIGILMAGYCIAMFAMTEYLYYQTGRNAAINIYEGILLSCIMILYYSIFDNPWISCLILALPILAYIYFTDSKLDKTTIAICLGMATVCNISHIYNNDIRFLISNIDLMPEAYYESQIETYPVFNWTAFYYYITGFVFAIACYITLVSTKRTVTAIAKTLLYLFIVGNIFVTFMQMNEYYAWRFDQDFIPYCDEWTRTLNILAALIVQAAFWFSTLFEKKENITKQGTYVIYGIVNACMLIMSIGILYSIDEYMPAYIISAFLTVVLASLNTWILLSTQNTAWAIYVGVKMTFLIMVIMHVVKFEPLTSIMLFCWAVACIILGLKFTQKHMRIYALILALISAVKLVIFDISYNNTVTRALSLIVCGILCFVISFIYHHIEKQTAPQKQTKTS